MMKKKNINLKSLNENQIALKKKIFKNPYKNLSKYYKIKQMNKIKEKNIINSYKKISLSLNNKIIFIFWNFILVCLINSILSKKVFNNNRKLNSLLSIDLKVGCGKNLKIISSSYIPKRIYINGNISEINEDGKVNIDNEGLNNVTLEWDEKFEKLEKVFMNIESIFEIDLSNFDTSGVISMKGMFLNCINLEYINFNNINTKNVDNMTSMFEGCNSLKSIDLSNFDTSQVKTMEYMFKDCTSITSLNLKNFRTPNLQKIREMFSGCISLKYLDLSKLNTTLIADMSSLFYSCSSLTSLNINNFNTKHVKILNSLFKFCLQLKYIELSMIDISSVVDMNSMFYNCNSLSSLNLSNFITSKVKDMGYMFYNCFSLRYLDISNFKTNKVENMAFMFYGCRSLISLDLSNFDLSKKNLGSFFGDCRSLLSIKFPKKNKLNGNIEGMFSRCLSIKSLDLLNFDFSLTNNMKDLFLGCSSLTSLDLSNVDATKVTNMINMFYGCESLKELNLTNFKTLIITNINYMFDSCFSLKSLDLNTFNTHLVQEMKNLFSNCVKLISLNLSNFNTSLVYDMSSMFEDCNSLELLDLSSFNTSLVVRMNKMFYGCIKLTSLDLSNFQTENTLFLDEMFNYCPNLYYINFYNYFKANGSIIDDIFYENAEKLIICINNQSNIEHLVPYLSLKKCIISQCPKDILNIELKIIYNKKVCIQDCLSDKIYKYEYDDFCYDKCPEGTYLSKNKKNMCEINIYDCIEKYPFLIIKDNNCAENCNSRDFFNNICTINNNNAQSKGIIISNIISEIQNGLLNYLIYDVLNGEKKDIIKRVNDTTYQITSSFNQNNKYYNNISTIKLGKCENILKNKYSIPENETLIIFKTETIIEGLLSPLIEYEIFDPKTNIKLNLSHCIESNISIDVLIPISINETIIYKYEPNSEYFKDICFEFYSETNIDLTLYERNNEFNNNKMSLCLNNCEYNGYDSVNQKVICHCSIQPRISLFSEIDKDKLISKIEKTKSFTNFYILKCYKLLLSKTNLIKNIGNYIMLIILFLYIPLPIYFYLKGYDLLCDQINDILNDDNLKIEKIKSFKKSVQFKEKIKVKASAPVFGLENKLYDFKIDLSKSGSEIKIEAKNNDNNLMPKNKYNKQQIMKRGKNDNFTDYEINKISYEEALEIDKRTYLQYYISLIKKNHILLFSFYPNKDYNSSIIKKCLFIFYFALFIVINTTFFNDTMMHKIYEDNGKFNFLYVLPQVIYTLIICSIIFIILKKISLSEYNILQIKNEKNRYNLKGKTITVIKRLIIKFNFFFGLTIPLLLLFWYYISCFCIVYKNTQIYLIKTILISYLMLLVYPFIICLFPAIFRIAALKKPGEYLYKISQILQVIQ